MFIQSDCWTREQVTKHRMFAPFREKQADEGVISHGLSPYGYAGRLGDVTIHSFALAQSASTYVSPDDVLTICVGNRPMRVAESPVNAMP